MSADQGFAKRTGKSMTEVKTNNGVACNLDDYKQAIRANVVRSSPEMSRPPPKIIETPSGIFASVNAAARSRPASAFPSMR